MRAVRAGMQVTPVIDHDHINALYFQQVQGILFEIATTSPGCAVDEDPRPSLGAAAAARPARAPAPAARAGADPAHRPAQTARRAEARPCALIHRARPADEEAAGLLVRTTDLAARVSAYDECA